MTWIDCKIRKPTIEDADENGEVLWRYEDGVISWPWDDTKRAIAWMPIPDFVPLPDPPEGYRLVDTTTEPFIADAKFWCTGEQCWADTTVYEWVGTLPYAVPVKPPEPQYRPFANAEEFRPFRDRWWRHQDSKTLHPPAHYNDSTHFGYGWEVRFRYIEFEDGTPFGIKIN